MHSGNRGEIRRGPETGERRSSELNYSGLQNDSLLREKLVQVG